MASSSAVKPKTDKLARFDPSEYELRKRLPAQMPRSPHHVYINMSTDFQYQMLRAKEIIFKGSNEVHIHGLGAAINRAINIALQVSRDLPRLDRASDCECYWQRCEATAHINSGFVHKNFGSLISGYSYRVLRTLPDEINSRFLPFHKSYVSAGFEISGCAVNLHL